MKLKNIGLATVNLFFAFVLCLNAYALPGDLDTTFDVDGKVVTQIGAADTAVDLAIQPDGKIVALGNTQDVGSDDDVVLVRYNADGSLDTSFGSGGKARAVETGRQRAPGFVIRPDGKFLVVITENTSPSNIAVYRFNSNGSLDAAFGNSGKAVLNFGSSSEANDVALQTDGKIVIAGKMLFGDFYRFTVFRMNADGTSDASFNALGYNAVTSFGGVFTAVALQSDGKIIAAGIAGGTCQWGRFNTDGTLEGSMIPTNFQNRIEDAVIQPDGKIIFSGYIGSSNSTFTIARYNADKTMDGFFGNSGYSTIFLGNNASSGVSVALQPNGKILVGGYAFPPSLGNYDFALARFNTNGVPDFSFGSNGIVLTNFNGGDDQIAGIALQPDNKVVALGRPGTNAFALARYNAGDAAAPYRSAFDYDGDAKADISVFRSNGVWYFSQSSNGAFVYADFGLGSDAIAPADYDGDGRTDFAFFRPLNGTWNIRYASGGSSIINFGVSDDTPVPADYDGDGKTDIAVYRASAGDWYRLNSSDGSFYGEHFGANGDKPVAADYDGDGKADIAVFRPSDGIWYITQSTAGFKAVQWGISTDIATPSAYIR